MRLLPVVESEGGKTAAVQRWEMGRTRVYFRVGALEELEEKRGRVLGVQVCSESVHVYIGVGRV